LCLIVLCHLGVTHAQAQEPALRTTDELTVLYTTAVLYGLGSSAWLALQVEPGNVAGALVPFAVLAPAGAALVAWADSTRPLRHGIPHALAAGMYLGLGEGLWLNAFQSAYSGQHAGVERWGPQRASTSLWLTSTAGGLAGALVGAINRPTPGRVSFMASTAIWSGALGALVAHAIVPNDVQRAQLTFASGALAYNVGLVGGLVLGPVVAPSVMRVRFVDLGGILGGLLAGGSYALFVRNVDSRALLGLAAVGGALGLGVATWATRDMPADRTHDGLPPLIGERAQTRSELHPSLVPVRGGFIAGFQGVL
jgi:hypothetical protein